MTEQHALSCDFCGQLAKQVRRVALDRGYDRLGRRHTVRFACPECSRAKDLERRAGLLDASELDGPAEPL